MHKNRHLSSRLAVTILACLWVILINVAFYWSLIQNQIGHLLPLK